MAALYDLKDRVAIVTGASRGIGRAIAIGLSACGAKVALSSRKEADLKQLAEEISASGGESLVVPCNMGKQEDVERLARTGEEKWGGADIVVNNAATSPYFGPFVETPLDAWDKTMDVNLRGPFLLSSLAAPGMKERGRGKIINISSNEGIDPSAELGAYSVSKAALIGMTKVLAKDLGPFGIQVNCVAPGLTKTDFARALFEDEKLYRYYVGKTALKRHGVPEEIAATVVFFASDESNFITGQTY
ncbi:MAG TPA: glucose 1-dehydrogenase, partial [Sneathiellales bacterium]|nr:glucose 1-dehydrogenase [Sneathiellales bacterium]